MIGLALIAVNLPQALGENRATRRTGHESKGAQETAGS
jgi:hypothetical protein